MKLLAFSVFDEKSGAYGHPFFMSAVGLATRMFGDWCNNGETPLGKHPGDYKLYQVGTWDDARGLFESSDPGIFVGMGMDYVERSETGPQEVKRARR